MTITTGTTTERPSTSTDALTRRDRAILKAVADGRAEFVHGTDLLLDGRCCCDQMAAQRLARAGLIAPLTQTRTQPGGGQRVPARLTTAGSAELSV